MTPTEIRFFLKTNKISSKKLSQATGYSSSTISNYLTGKMDIPKAFLDILHHLYGDKLHGKN